MRRLRIKESHLNLISFLAKAENRIRTHDRQHHLNSFTLFGNTIDYGLTVGEERDAASALTDVIFNQADIAILNAHRNAVTSNNELKAIDQSLKRKIN